jgi:hypothetical protein
MSDWMMKVIKAEASRLIELAADDDELRADLQSLAREILAATEAKPNAEVKLQSASSSADTPENETQDQEAGAEPLRELTLGRRSASAAQGSSSPPGRSGSVSQGAELSVLEARCSEKADVARWVAEGHRTAQDGAEPRDELLRSDPEIQSWAEKLTDGFYWMNAASSSSTSDMSALEHLAGCFDAVSAGLALVKASEAHPKGLARGLPLLAEAQSALRRALSRLNVPSDPDQEGVYEWVRATAARHRIFLRHMRSDDLADPADWPKLVARIEDERASGQKTPAQLKELERIENHQKQIVEAQGTVSDWSEIIDAVEELVGGNLPASSKEIRDLLLPIIDELPEREELPRNFQRVLKEIDRFLATRPQAVRPEPAHEPIPEVKRARELLCEKSIVVIGGSRRREVQASLKKALGLKSLIWIETKEHQSIETFAPVIARPEVTLVLLAIRWSSHAFGEVRQFCEHHHKPLVRLPGGYGVNQVAAQIVMQSSEQLTALRGS